MRLLMLDNYDSFTYNLVQLIRENSNFEIEIKRNDEITLAEVNQYDAIVLSPGPGIPIEAGILCELIRTYKHTKPILGVCLGMQAIGEVFGASLNNLEEPFHGIQTQIMHTSSKLFNTIPTTFNAGRYHSWVIDEDTLTNEFQVTAVDEHNHVMAIEHISLPIAGVQFHPESILTDFGKEIITNFLNQVQ